MQKGDNCIFKNNQDRWGKSYLSKHLSNKKRSNLLASPVKLVFCWLCPLLTKEGQHMQLVGNIFLRVSIARKNVQY
jgi:hypothetical protein